MDEVEKMDPGVAAAARQVLAHQQQEEQARQAAEQPAEPAETVKPKSSREGKDPAYSTIRNVPKDLVEYIQHEFPGHPKQTDALVAFCVCYGPGELQDLVWPQLTVPQRNLVRAWKRRPAATLEQQVGALGEQMANLTKLAEILEVLGAYTVFDRLGFRRHNPPSPDLADLNETGVMELLYAAEDQAERMQREKKKLEGKPVD